MFAFFDGDNIGPTLEALLLKNELQKANTLSDNINSAMQEIRTYLETEPNVKIHILGGDDILIEYDHLNNNDISTIDNVRKIFLRRTGLPMSCGIGDSINEAIWNLHKAKLFGRDRVYGQK